MDNIDYGMHIEDERLFDYAVSTARLLKADGEGSGRKSALMLRRRYADIRRCHETVERRYGRLSSPPAACEWLLDNWYMVQREYHCASAALAEAKHLRLASGEAVIEQLCAALVNAGHGRVNEERCRIFLQGFQTVTVLSRRELALFPAAIKGAVICSIARVCESMQYASGTESHAEALSALFSTLRLFSVLDTEELLNSADITGAILEQDPTGEYGRMDISTRREYLRRLERLARAEGVEEHVYARRLIGRAAAENRHVGFYLFSEPSRVRAAVYISANVLLSFFISLWLAFLFDSALAAVLLLLPVSELIKSFIDFILLHILTPRHLPRMNTENGIPPEGRTICVISALLGDGSAGSRLEELRLACRNEGRNLCFGLLADLPAAKTAATAKDAGLISDAMMAVSELNRKYGGGFYLFTRPRRFNGEEFTGHERKRGAIIELAKLLCGEPSELQVTGDRDALSGTRYILTLDSDTRIYPGTAGKLIGAAIHPLNTPVTDPEKKTVVSGHALIQPRMDTELMSANATDFALIFAGAGGSDPYGGICGELYMDAFKNGGFAGKGIIDASALLACAGERFPEGRILSHDALEGAYLRGAYMGDAEFSDSFPTRPLSYYKRLHRWVRGDWQNAPWIFRRELTDIDRWRLFDSLRRSLISPMTLSAILAGFFLSESGLKVAAWAALFALLSGLLLSLAERSREKHEKVRLRRYTRLLSGVGGAMVQAFIRLWLLPFDAWICLSAIFTALWRMLVSRKRLLQWQTAAQSEQGSETLAQHIKAMWPSVLLGILLIAFSPAIIGKVSGFMWLLSPAVAAALALPAYREASLGSADREYLISAAAGSWRYLSEFSTAEDNFLPPDNFQEQPPAGLAHRSSPTNIGLAMVSAAAACDMGIITRGTAVEYIKRITDTLERMERCMGHFYNWYDTRTLSPLTPAYISTVDSGNMYAGLLTVSQALSEYGETGLKRRIDSLLSEMDFSPLYDKNRGLFYICYDTESSHGAGGWYDLMASEAMLTSYIAIAKGDIPVRHWRRLSRAQLQKDGYRGLASWTGTMFEYLMPELFLPVYRSSLLYESAKFCVYAQKKRAYAGKPWGISESAFYSLDASLSYRYKAHGCAALALKRGQDADMVISPYSSFLALAVEPQSAVRNLRRLESFGAVGRWGYMEALDFTPGRCRSDSGEQVRCYMAHHTGMSIIAAANAVCGGSIRRRFMASPSMSAYSLLLQEKLPSNAVVIRRDMTQVPEKPQRSTGSAWQLRGGEEDAELHCTVLSNGAYSMIATNRGKTQASLGDLVIYRMDGLGITLDTPAGHESLAPMGNPELWELSCRNVRCVGTKLGIECTSSVFVGCGDCGELRQTELRAREDCTAELTLSFKPVIASESDYNSHPAFWELGIYSELADGMLLLRRLRRGDRAECWLCLACNEECEFSADRSGSIGWLSSPFVTAKTRIQLTAGLSRTVRFAICTGGSRADAVDGAQRILGSSSADCGDIGSAASALLGMEADETGAAMDMLPALCFGIPVNAAPRSDLWQYGISGDLPIICCDGRALESEKLLRRFCLLKSCGINAELVYFSDEQGEYQQPLLRRIGDALASVGLESLIGCRGGVHFVPGRAKNVIISRAVIAVGSEPLPLPALDTPVLSAPREYGKAPLHGWSGKAFEFFVNRSLPSRAWQHILTNGSYGYIAADCGMGGMWFENAREMRIDMPPENIRDVQGQELLYAETAGHRISLFAANDGFSCKLRFEPGAAVWEKDVNGRAVRTTAFVPTGSDCRVFVIQGAAGLRLKWLIKPVLGAADASSLLCRTEDGVLIAENPEAYLPGAEFVAVCSSPWDCTVNDNPPALTASFIGEETTVLVCGCCGALEAKELCLAHNASAALEGVRQRWELLLGRLKIETKIPALDHYMNYWAAYQGIACRLEGRSSLYQSGGAIGFRDQLQDAVNLLLINTAYARDRILDCCRHQYVEGDVMHWWHRHPHGDRGVRTRCSDDLLWLTWALCEYTDATGDYALCDEEINYISSPILSAAEHDRYETPECSPARASVLDHARAALECCISRGFGSHGLPLFGSGDWNDGFDRADGESVWLGWFFAHCAKRFSLLLARLQKSDFERYARYADEVADAAGKSRSGAWFLRGYNSDGTPLGGSGRIDSLPQSWAVLCALTDSAETAPALDAALERLVDREHRIIRLFDPPFSPDEPSPGYITSYGEGFRENGGQYTHGAIWLALACIESGRTDDGFRILAMLLPESHDLQRYEAEPFVLAADVYSAPGHEGEAGWTWYTGSALWYLRAVTRHLLGLRLEGGKLYIRPKLPSALSSYSAEWTDSSGAAHKIEVRNGAVTVDGSAYDGGGIG